MNFREYISRAASEVLDYVRARGADSPHAGRSWCMELQANSGKCLFKSLAVANKSGATAFWVWVCDSATTADKPTCVPLYVPASSNAALDWTEAPLLMMNGIYVCATSDPQTKTLITAADAFFEVAYEIKRT